MERLAHLRRRRLLTQRELANQLGLTVQAIQKWEAGTALPRMASLRHLCEILGVSIEELLTPEEQERVFGGHRAGRTAEQRDTATRMRPSGILQPNPASTRLWPRGAACM